jgi:hypothetical protein
MAEVRVECHAGYPGDETPRRFHLGGRTIEISEVLSRWQEPGALFFRVRSDEGRIYVLRRMNRRGAGTFPRWRADGKEIPIHHFTIKL